MLFLVAPVDNPYHHHQDVFPPPVVKILIWLTHAFVLNVSRKKNKQHFEYSFFLKTQMFAGCMTMRQRTYLWLSRLITLI